MSDVLIRSLPLSEFGDTFRPINWPANANSPIEPPYEELPNEKLNEPREGVTSAMLLARVLSRVSEGEPRPRSDVIGHYNGHPSSPPVYCRHIGHLDGEAVTGLWDVLVCPEMALRVEFPRTIKTWGELARYLNNKFLSRSAHDPFVAPK